MLHVGPKTGPLDRIKLVNQDRIGRVLKKKTRKEGRKNSKEKNRTAKKRRKKDKVKLDVVAHACNISSREARAKGERFETSLGT